jgi:hypothetical protein
MSSIGPGADGDRVPDGEAVFKLVLPSSAAPESSQAEAGMFALSTRERDGSGRLSVCVSRLTTPEQAWAFLDNNPKYTYMVCLNVDKIRSIRFPGKLNEVAPLDVVWHPMAELAGKAGAEGHAGIVGLHDSARPSSAERKFLRKELAKIAELRRFR